MEALAAAFEAMGYTVDRRFYGQQVVTILNYPIRIGRFAGQRISVGIPAPDYPNTPPSGVHFSATLGVVGQNNVHASPLGPAWQYFSRQLPDWGRDRSARHVISYVNKVLNDA